MKSENLYLIDEEQMERIEEIISEFQSIYLDIYSNRGVSCRSDRFQKIDNTSSPTIFDSFTNKTIK